MSDAIFTTHRVEIPVKKLNEPIYLLPFGDVHRFAPMCDEERWHEFLDWAKNKSKQGQCYFLGMGDYDDLASTSERFIIKNPHLHESTAESLDDYARDRVRRMADEMSFMKGKLIGLVEGNHHWKFENATTSTQYMCEQLGCKYLGGNSFIRLSFRLAYTKTNKRASLDMFVHHGRGSARLHGSSLNTVQQMEQTANADIYLMGHDHKKGVSTMNKLELKEGKGSIALHKKKILLGRTGSFLKAYTEGKASYVVKAGLGPADLGTIKIELTPKFKGYKNPKYDNNKRERKDHFYVDLHASI